MLIYLPFENSQHIIDLLAPLKRNRFVMHCGDLAPGQYGNVTVRGFSRDGFKVSLHQCGSVICNAGFELTSEALALGKRILVKPLHGQMEQSSNAAALEQLGLGQVMPELSATAIAYFLATGERQLVNYPNVAEAIVDWLQQYPARPVSELVSKLWQDVQFSSPKPFRPLKPPPSAGQQGCFDTATIAGSAGSLSTSVDNFPASGRCLTHCCADRFGGTKEASKQCRRNSDRRLQMALFPIPKHNKDKGKYNGEGKPLRGASARRSGACGLAT